MTTTACDDQLVNENGVADFSIPFTDTWCWSMDGERYEGMLRSREDAIKAATADIPFGGVTVFVGKTYPPIEILQRQAEWLGLNLFDVLRELLGDEVGEVAERFTLSDEQQKELGSVIVDWISKNARFDFYGVKNIVEIVVPPSDGGIAA